MNSERIAIIGSNGQLGSDLLEVFRKEPSFDVVPLTRAECDCTKQDQVHRVFQKYRPGTVINCAAYVRVDDCEDHPLEAFELNAIGALHVARACVERRARCVYISTDYVFEGTKPTAYIEADEASPVNTYGASKLAGEQLVRQAGARWLIVRMASLFGKNGARGKGGNFVETVIAKAKAGEPLKVVNDVCMSPTYTRDAAHGMLHLVKAEMDGVVHLTNQGACTWYEFATQVLSLAGINASVRSVSSEEYTTRARRPRNSALQSNRCPVKLRTWQEAVMAYLTEKGHIPSSLG
jgi:dTDP-4-dehydrorhamnose reductase